MQPARTMGTVLALLGPAAAWGQTADGAEPPNFEFLEYLGSWESSDEDWVVVAEQFMGRPDAAGDEIAAEPVTQTDAETEAEAAAAADAAAAAKDEADENDE